MLSSLVVAKTLTLLDPLSLVKLRETGRCFINLPEEIFDLDYPGHYFRHIKSVSLTLPCVVGPYTTVSCTLRLLKSSIRINTKDADKADNYPRHNNGGVPIDDDRFIENNIPVKEIAPSSAQNDSGLFKLSFRDERYLPFEGAGVVSQWSLELFNDNSEDFGKALRQFDYNTITDTILHIKYTAREDVGRLRTEQSPICGNISVKTEQYLRCGCSTYVKSFLPNGTAFSTLLIQQAGMALSWRCRQIFSHFGMEEKH